MSWSVIDSFIPTACHCPLTASLFCSLPVLSFSISHWLPDPPSPPPVLTIDCWLIIHQELALFLLDTSVGDGLTGWPRTTLSTPFLPALRSLDIPFTLGNRNFAILFSLSFLAILSSLNDEVLQSLTTFDIHGPLVPPFN